MGIPIVGQWTHTLGSAFQVPWPGPTTTAAVSMLNIHDIMFARNVPMYIATRRWCVLKVTPQLAIPGAESVVYDCLVCHVTLSRCYWLHCSQIRELLADGHDGVQKHKNLMEVSCCVAVKPFNLATINVGEFICKFILVPFILVNPNYAIHLNDLKSSLYMKRTAIWCTIIKMVHRCDLYMYVCDSQ